MGIIDSDMNHELKIINQLRNTFAHEINPMEKKIPNIIKKFKFYDECKVQKTDNLVGQAGRDGFIVGTITAIVTRKIANILWETQFGY